MKATIRLFDDNAYLKTTQATVLSCDKTIIDGKEVYQVVLDQTIFFPEGGGQSPDRGTMNGSRVLDVQIQNDVITHTIAENVMVGSKVECHLDWGHRFSNMQQHSGEHIFSGLVHAQYGYNNVGFHLSDQVVTMDFSGPLSEDQVTEIEWRVNDCITKNTPFEITYPSKEELEQLDYRSKIEIDGQVRIVTVPGYDVCACCGTHVKNAGEIGILKVVNTQNYKGGIRITILCGFRALEDYRQKQKNVAAISGSLSVKQEEIAKAVEKLKKEYALVKQQLNTAKEQMMIQKIAQMERAGNDICLFENDANVDVMRSAVNALTEKCDGYCGVFAGNDDSGYRYIIGIREGDAREMGNQLKEKFHAKGGGKPAMIQGSVQASEKEIRGLFE